MLIQINGEIFWLNSKKLLSLRAIVRFLGYKENIIALEHNEKIVVKSNWDKIFLKKNDKIEIVTIVGGG